MNLSNLKDYSLGLGATFAGAWGTEVTESMLPLALGASVTLMCTVSFVRKMLRKKVDAPARRP